MFVRRCVNTLSVPLLRFVNSINSAALDSCALCNSTPVRFCVALSTGSGGHVGDPLRG